VIQFESAWQLNANINELITPIYAIWSIGKPKFNELLIQQNICNQSKLTYYRWPVLLRYILQMNFDRKDANWFTDIDKIIF
jgi:hypothetical protein